MTCRVFGLTAFAFAFLSGCLSRPPGSIDRPPLANFTFSPSAEMRGDRGARLLNAYWLARLSDLAYSDEPTLTTKLGELGIDLQKADFMFIENVDTSTEGFYLRTDDVAILSFRGTQTSEQRDKDTDNDSQQIPKQLGWAGAIAHGFYTAFDSVWEDRADGAPGLRTWLRARHSASGTSTARTGPPLFITGHSLGAALATVATHHSLFAGCIGVSDVPGRCDSNYIPVAALYTFGSPRVGDSAFAETLAARADSVGTAIYRFVNARDVVTTVPTTSYEHVGHPGDAEATYLEYLAPPPKESLKERTALDAGDFALQLAAGTDRLLADHAISEYERKILNNVER